MSGDVVEQMRSELDEPEHALPPQMAKSAGTILDDRFMPCVYWMLEVPVSKGSRNGKPLERNPA